MLIKVLLYLNILVANINVLIYSVTTHEGGYLIMAKSAAARKKEQRERDKELDIKQINIRVHIDDEKSVKDHAQALLEKRLKNTKD